MLYKYLIMNVQTSKTPLVEDKEKRNRHSVNTNDSPKPNNFKRSNTMGKGFKIENKNEIEKEESKITSKIITNNDPTPKMKVSSPVKIPKNNPTVNTTSKKNKSKDKKNVTFNKEFIEYVDISRHVHSQNQSALLNPKNGSFIEPPDTTAKPIKTLEDKSMNRLAASCCCVIF